MSDMDRGEIGRDFARLEDRLRIVEARTVSVETSQAVWERVLGEQSKLIHRVMVALIALIAALVGKETYISVSEGSPFWEDALFVGIAICYGGLAIYLVLEASYASNGRMHLFISAWMVIFAALLRVDMGLAIMGLPNLFIAVLFGSSGVIYGYEMYLALDREMGGRT